MIEKIYLENFILIEKAEIELNNNFAAFVGETGAGKSIIIDAIGYLTGNKIDKEVVGKFKDKAIIEGYFQLNDEIKNILNDNNIEFDDYLIVTKIISKDKKSITKINGVGVTIVFLNSLMKNFIDIHSQKEGNYLLENKNHLKLIDKFSDIESHILKFKNDYDNYKKLIIKKNELLETQYNEREIEYLINEIDEIEKANLSIDEENELIDKSKNIKNFIKINSSLTEAIELFENNINTPLYKLYQTLSINNEYLEKISNNIKELYYNLIDNIDNIKEYYNNFNLTDSEIDKIEERLFIYNKLKRKYGINVEEVLNYCLKNKEKVEIYNNKESHLTELEKEIKKMYDTCLTQAKYISNLRKENASIIENLIKNELSDLELKKNDFIIQFKEKELNEDGIDDVEFLISLNAGENPKPLNKIASGGELSRILLSLKVILSNKFGIKTIIFDEIDVGVSGKVSAAIGRKMAIISKNTQLLLISHSPQVISFANDIYFVKKTMSNNNTISDITKLKNDEIIREIAIMQSAIVNEVSINAAKQLYQESQKIYEN